MAWYVFKFVIFPFIFLTIQIVGQSAILHPGFPRSSQILFYSKLYLINFKLHSAKNSFLFTFEKAWFLLSSTTWHIFTSSCLLPHETYLLLFTKLNWQAFPRYISHNHAIHVNSLVDTGRKLNVHKSSEDVLEVFWTCYVRSIYVLCLLGAPRWIPDKEIIFLVQLQSTGQQLPLSWTS